MFRAALLALMPALILLYSPSSYAVYKCTDHGTVAYSDLPCHGQQSILSEPPAAQSGITQEARLTREQAEVKRLQTSREQRERQDQHYRNMQMRGYAAQQKKCRTLALQNKWKEEDARTAAFNAQTKARRNARRALEKYNTECS
jgi:hypothetical protein